MTNNDEVKKSPNEILAEEITAELFEADLIPENRTTALESKLKNGGVSQDDWNLWVDMATDPEKTEEADYEQANYQD